MNREPAKTCAKRKHFIRSLNTNTLFLFLPILSNQYRIQYLQSVSCLHFLKEISYLIQNHFLMYLCVCVSVCACESMCNVNRSFITSYLILEWWFCTLYARFIIIIFFYSHKIFTLSTNTCTNSATTNMKNNK